MSTTKQNFIQVGLGVSVLRMRDFAPLDICTTSSQFSLLAAACKLLFTDTDSFCCHIQTEDLYKDMSQNLDMFDTSNFETTHTLYTTKNHRALGKFKSETGSLAPLEFLGLRAKMYSLLVPDNLKESKIRAKGIKKSYVKKNVRHEQFLGVLKTFKSTPSTFCTFQSKNHVLRTVEINKTCLNAFDD